MNLLITGGASGLGEAITRKVASNPANVVWFTYNRSIAKARAIESAHSNAHAIPCDFRVDSDVVRLQSEMEKMDLFGLVNNALPVRIARQHFHKLDPAAFAEGFDFAILPTLRITQCALKHFRAKKAGRIVTILTAALAGKPPPGYAEYAAAKAYLFQLAKSWSCENAAFGITSNCISPGFMLTDLTKDTDQRIIDDMINRHPLKRLLETGEVAEVVEFFDLLASDQWDKSFDECGLGSWLDFRPLMPAMFQRAIIWARQPHPILLLLSTMLAAAVATLLLIGTVNTPVILYQAF